MTFKNIPEEKWTDVVDLICDIAGADDDGEDRVVDEYTFDLHCMLDSLQQSYGIQPLIISTRADFTEEIEEQVRLYKEAIALAEQAKDPVCIVQSAESLAQLFIEELADPEQGAEWFNQLKSYVAEYSDEWLCGEMSELEQALQEIS